MTFMGDWTSMAVTLNHVGCVRYPCRCQSLQNDVVDDDTFPAAFSDLCVSFFSSSSRLRIAPRLYTCYSVLFLPLSLGSPPVYRKSSWPTNKHPSPPLTDRKQSGRAELRGCCGTFPRDPSITPTQCTSLAPYLRKDCVSAWTKQ